MRNETDRVLIVGGDSLIGSALHIGLTEAGVPHDFTTRRQTGRGIFLDLAAPQLTWTLPGNYTGAIFCAARTRLADCQEHPEQTTLINVTRTAELATRLSQQGTFIVFLSTNLVFDGSRPQAKSDDPLCPVSEYGIQKAKAEAALRSVGPKLAIVRLTKVVHSRMPIILDWVDQLRQNKPIHPFTNRVFSPLPLRFAIEALIQIVQAKSPGTYQLSADEEVTYARFASILAEGINASPDFVQPIISKETSPPFSTLNCEFTNQHFGFETPSAEASLRELATSFS